MTTIDRVVRHVESLSGHPLGPDEGVHHGLADRTITAATVSWMASPEAIRSAGQSGHELLIVHESLYYPYDVLHMPDPPADWEDWLPNRRRRELLDRHGLTCLRVHGSADDICVLDAFVELLGLGEPVVQDGPARVYEIPPCSLAELVERVKRRLGLPHVRVADAGHFDRVVRRVGLPWGGLGLFVNVAFQQRLAALNPDVFIAGESDSYGMRFAVETGIPMIETSHEASENPGLKRFTALLAEAFPEVRLRFFEDPCVWRIA